MTRDETLALYAQGKNAWNAWAAERLAGTVQIFLFLLAARSQFRIE